MNEETKRWLEKGDAYLERAANCRRLLHDLHDFLYLHSLIWRACVETSQQFVVYGACVVMRERVL